MSVKVFYDIMSQPARAVILFCRANKKFIPFTPNPIALRKFEQQTEEYAQINPMKKVPAIVDGNFKLTESVAILKYLCDKYNVPDHWYPKDLERRAKVDEYMGWQHINTRMNCAKVFVYEVLLPKATGSEMDPGKLSTAIGEMEETLTNLENIFLKDKPYLCGNDISIADLLGVCEVEQVSGTGRDISVAHPRLGAWVQRVRQQLNPDFDEIHSLVYKLRDRNRPKYAKL
ncbi:glutathione S-transferase theta-1-like [Amphiura filiformis]|uniref:glutathione S-transferase theta-1-like n=1 Tax=Amphiura filiformis TaxID=82378 RepID=UPI003B224D8B